MKIKNINDPEKFLNVIDSCEGKVELISSEGDRLNLKSLLCRYVALTNLCGKNKLKNLEIIADNPRDTQKILMFLISG